jgi:putative intracellular protease/amidase
VVPGGALETAMQTQDPAVLAWIQKMDKTTIYTASVCTGAWILGAADLLKGKKATTHWYRAKEMLTRYGAKFQKSRCG